MRNTLKELLRNSIVFEYRLPETTKNIPKATISTNSDCCFRNTTTDQDITKVIYNGIVEYSFDDTEIDISKLDNLTRRALRTRLRYNECSDINAKIKYGFYGEIMLYLIIEHFFGANTLITRGLLYNPLESSETKGYDTYQLRESNGEIQLWFGEVKFYGEYKSAVKSILDKISKTLSDEYLSTNFIAIEKHYEMVHSNEVKGVIDAWRDNPQIILIDEIRNHNMKLVYPMLVLYNKENKTYEDSIKEVISYINSNYPSINNNLSIPSSIFFVFLPIENAKKIKTEVLKCISIETPLI